MNKVISIRKAKELSAQQTGYRTKYPTPGHLRLIIKTDIMEVSLVNSAGKFYIHTWINPNKISFTGYIPDSVYQWTNKDIVK